MLKIRRPNGRLIFNMGIPIPGKTVFYIETGPCLPTWAIPTWWVSMDTMGAGNGSPVTECNGTKWRTGMPSGLQDEITYKIWLPYIDGLVQEWRNSSALAMELRLSCTNPSMSSYNHLLSYNLTWPKTEGKWWEFPWIPCFANHYLWWISWSWFCDIMQTGIVTWLKTFLRNWKLVAYIFQLSSSWLWLINYQVGFTVISQASVQKYTIYHIPDECMTAETSVY